MDTTVTVTVTVSVTDAGHTNAFAIVLTGETTLLNFPYLTSCA